MFSFLYDEPYENRKVACDNWQSSKITLSTYYVNDGVHDYETALVHPEYNASKWMVIESYDTKEQAIEGHAKWKDLIETQELPNEIVDAMNGEAAALAMEITQKPWVYQRNKKEN